MPTPRKSQSDPTPASRSDPGHPRGHPPDHPEDRAEARPGNHDQEADAPRPQAPWLVGQSDVLRTFTADLERLAASDATVLLQGESGTGKGQAARLLHALGPRASAPLVEVGLSALAPTLIEAELFGHEEGAFTGAEKARPGRFRRANGGTLVLERVESLPEGLQGKLLRALQERTISPLGSMEELPIDVRVVATSARNLRDEVEAGRFREDLYYRIAVVTLDVPPLRARSQDLPQLVAALTARLGESTGVAPRAMRPEALDRLAQHPWPGNVRELENALERVLILPPQGQSGKDLGIGAEELAFLGEAVRGSAGRIASEALAHGLRAEELDRALLEAALREERGNVSAAARRLGLTRRTFEYRLSRLNGERDDTGESS